MFDLEKFLPYRLYQATENSSQTFRDIYQQKHGLTRAEWRVMFNIGQYGPISAKEIVQRTYMDKTKISRAVQNLVERKLVKRSGDLKDRRKHTLELSARGSRMFANLSELAAEHNARIAKVVGEDRVEEFLDVLAQIESAQF